MQKTLAEFLGTSILALAVVGSGAMAQILSDDVGLQLLINASATAAVLWLVITLFGPISGAHFNPLVSAVDYSRKKLSLIELLKYVIAQSSGAIAGTLLANALFTRHALQISEYERGGWNILLSEVIATAGLIFLIFHLIAIGKDKQIAHAVAAWIFGAYFFTSSTSFANPAITVGRIFTESFAGIEPLSALVFIPFQIIGAVLGYITVSTLNKKAGKA